MKTFISIFVLLIVFSLVQVNVYTQPLPLYSIQSSKPVENFNQPGFLSAAFSLDGTKLASGNNVGSGDTWDVKSGLRIAKLQLAEHLAELNWLQFSLDGSLVIGGGTSHGDGAVVAIWNANTGEIVQRFTLPNKRNRTFPFIRSDSGVITPDNRQALIGNDRELSLWDISSGQLVQDFEMLSQSKPEFENVIWPIQFFPDGQRIAVSDGVRGLVIINWQTGKFLHGFTGNVQLSSNLKTVFGRGAITVDGVSIESVGKVTVLDVDKGAIVNEFPIDDLPSVTNISFSPNRTLFLHTEDQKLAMQRVLPSKALEQISTFTPPAPDFVIGTRDQMKFSPDGEHFFVFSGENGFLYRINDFLSGIPNAEMLDN